MTKQELKTLSETIENLIDKFGADVFFSSASQVLRGKAQHIQENWQDEPLSKTYEIMACICEDVVATYEHGASEEDCDRYL